MTQKSPISRPQFWRNDIRISSSSPPEDILPAVTGGFGLWQISIISCSLFSHFLSELEIRMMKISLPSDLNFTCADGNGSRCVTANGSVCTDFVFFKTSQDVLSFTEELGLICKLGNYPEWIRNCYRSGLAVGFIITGALVDRFGQKLVSVIGVSLHCLTGMLIFGMHTIATLFLYVISHAVVSVVLMLVPFLAVCDSVGNKWRTFGLGISYIPRSVAVIVVPHYYRLFENAYAAIAITSLIPLVLLIPLLYFHDSPNYVCLLEEFEKSEKALLEIARCNRSRIPETTRLRPVQTVLSSNIPDRTTFFQMFVHDKIRETFMALFTFWFFMGYTNGTLTYFAHPDVTDQSEMGFCGLVGYIMSLVLCHWFSQRILLGIFEVSKCLSLAGLFTYVLYFENYEGPAFVVLSYVSSFFYMASLSTAVIITPRMFPTELRGKCFGVCGSMYHFGYFVARILHLVSKDVNYITGFFLIVSPVCEIGACFWFWDVHNRELPDFLIDCIRFRKYYKPTRFLMIYDLEHYDETEIQVLDFT